MDKNLLILLLTVLFVQVTVYSQVPPPPPPPLIYVPPTNHEIKEFVSAECGYAISFAGELEIGKRPDACLYVGAKRKGSAATFRMIRFSEDDLIKHPPDEVFEMIKAAYLTPGRYKLTDSKELELYGVKGFDFTFNDGIRYRRVRAFIKDKVLYEFYVDVTNWHILTKHRPEIAKSFETEVSRFFSSFRFLSKN